MDSAPVINGSGTSPLAGTRQDLGDLQLSGGIPLEAKYERAKELLYQQAADMSRIETETAAAKQRQLAAEQAYRDLEHRVGLLTTHYNAILEHTALSLVAVRVAPNA